MPLFVSLRHCTYLLAMITVATVTGCASIENNRSEAWKLTKAADAEWIDDASSNSEHQEQSSVYRHMANIGLSASQPTSLGLSDLRYETLAFNVLFAVMDMNTTRSYEKTWLAGWYPWTPEQDPKKIHRMMFDTYEAAALGALEELGLKYEKYLAVNTSNVGTEDDTEDFYRYAVFLIDEPDYNCNMIVENNQGKRDSNCALVVRAGGLEDLWSPMVAQTPGVRSWSFGYPENHFIRFTMNDAQLPTVDFHKAVSERMPQWAFMFQPDAGNYVMMSEEAEAKGYPYWLHQGNELHFVTPNQSE